MLSQKDFTYKLASRGKSAEESHCPFARKIEWTKDEWGVISQDIDKRTRICSGIRICFARLQIMRMMMSLLMLLHRLLCPSTYICAVTVCLPCCFEPSLPSQSPSQLPSLSVSHLVWDAVHGTWGMHKWLPHKTCYLYLLLIVAAALCPPFSLQTSVNTKIALYSNLYSPLLLPKQLNGSSHTTSAWTILDLLHFLWPFKICIWAFLYFCHLFYADVTHCKMNCQVEKSKERNEAVTGWMML